MASNVHLMGYLGDFPYGATVYVPFGAYSSANASITITGLAVTDIEIYKNGGVTQRASDNGYTLLDTDGIDFDGITGIHGFSVDTADNTTAGFYAPGNDYQLVVSAITVDAQTVNFVFTFSIENRHVANLLARTTIATLASQTGFTLTAGSVDDNAYNGCLMIIQDAASVVQKAVAVILDYTGATKTITLLTDPAIFTMAVGDYVSIYADRALKATVDNRTVDVDADGGVEVDTIQTGGIPSGALASGELTNIADATWKRDMSAITGESARSPLNAIRKLMNRVRIVAGVATVYKEDDSTAAFTQNVTTTAGNPISEVDTV